MRALISLTHFSEVIATKNTTLINTCIREHVASSSNRGLVRPLNIKFKSHVDIGSQTSRDIFYIPVRKCFVMGCVNSDVPSIFWWNALSAAKTNHDRARR